jgi:uncharacterized protein
MSDSVTPKPRVRVQAGSSSRPAFTADSFQNFAANLGYPTLNVSSNSSYGFNPITRDRNLLEWMYRGSWLVRKVIDCVADDMTREGISIESDMKPDEIDELTQYWTNLQLWQRLNEAIKWSRLYGGCLAVFMIDGQDASTPLRLETVGKGQFKGLMTLDRWQVYPETDNLVRDFGAGYGLPEYYQVVADARTVPRMRIHHTRVIRFDGIQLPYWQKMAENEWGLSVLEPMFDRMVAFDSATQGAAQLVYKAHLRVLKLPQFRELIASGGVMYQKVLQQIALIRAMQTNEGLTVIDGEDDFQVNQYSFAGLSDMLIQFSQQVSGGADIPMTRLFGQSPAGMNATGESDLRNYYDGLKSVQEARLRRGVKILLDLSHRSLRGVELPNGFNFSFTPLWQLTPETKATVATAHTNAVSSLLQDGVFTLATAMKEIRQSSRVTGFGSNITDEDIEAAENAPPMMGPMGEEPVPGMDPGEEVPNEPRLLTGPGPRSPVELNTRQALQRLAIQAGARDRRSIADVHGLQVVVETAKGESRFGYGWAVTMPAHYGYISGTSSAEGPQEQMDCFLGDNLDSTNVWVIEQLHPDTKVFDEHKVFLGFDSRDQVLQVYNAAFSDGRGPDRVGNVRQMTVDVLKAFLDNWRYGKPGSDRPPLRAGAA